MMPPFGSLLDPPTNLRGGQSSIYVKKEPVDTSRSLGMEPHPSKGIPQSAFSSYHPLRKPLQHEQSAFGPFSAVTTQSFEAIPISTKTVLQQPTTENVGSRPGHDAHMVGSRPKREDSQAEASRRAHLVENVQPRHQSANTTFLKQQGVEVPQQFQEMLRMANAMLSKSSEVGSSGLVTGTRRHGDTASDSFVAGQRRCKLESEIASSSFSAPPLTRKRSYSELAEESCDSELVLGIGGRSSREGSEYRNSRASSPRKSQKCDTRLELVSADLCLAPPAAAQPEYSSSSSHQEMPSISMPDLHAHGESSKVSQSHGANVSATESHLSFQKIKSQNASTVEGVTGASQSESPTGLGYQQPVRSLLNLEIIKRECEAVERERNNEDSLTQPQTHESVELGLFPGASSPVHPGEGKKPETSGLQLVTLLLGCANAVSKGKIDIAAQKLDELYSHASLFGDSMQRIAAHFTEGLAARIVGKDSPIYKTFMQQNRLDDYLSAFTTLYKVCPYFQFGHFTANQAILEAFEGHSVVHVVDLDLMQGFQWPGLIQSLSEREDGPPKLKLTGIGTSCTSLQDTGRRLASFAATYNVPFEFHAVVGELEDLTPTELGAQPGEAVAVNCVMQLHRLLNHPTCEKLQSFIAGLRSMRPVVLTLVEQEANHNTTAFLGRFVEALHYYAAVFDSLDSSLPLASEERARIEQMHFAQQIKNIVACEGMDRVERHETLEAWRRWMELVGFKQEPLSSHAVTQAKLLLSLAPCDGYRLSQQPGGSISLGWQDRSLLTASAWVL